MQMIEISKHECENIKFEITYLRKNVTLNGYPDGIFTTKEL